MCEPFVVTLSSSGAEQQLIIVEEQSVLLLEKKVFLKPLCLCENSRISSLQRPFEARPFAVGFLLQQALLYVSLRLSGLCSKAPVLLYTKGGGLVYTVYC